MLPSVLSQNLRLLQTMTSWFFQFLFPGYFFQFIYKYTARYWRLRLPVSMTSRTLVKLCFFWCFEFEPNYWHSSYLKTFYKHLETTRTLRFIFPPEKYILHYQVLLLFVDAIENFVHLEKCFWKNMAKITGNEEIKSGDL